MRIKAILLMIAVVCVTLLDGKYVCAAELPMEPSQEDTSEGTEDGESSLGTRGYFR